jgi:hypothetical protein
MKRLLLMPFLSLAAFAQTMPNAAIEGPKIIAEAFAKLSGALGEAIAKGGPASALSVCSEKAPQIAADDAKTAVLATFAEAMAKQEAPKPQVITNADGTRSFLSPVVLGNPLCLQCNGTPNQDIAPVTLAEIQKLYPDDKATGFKIGDLRGLWRVTFLTQK